MPSIRSFIRRYMVSKRDDAATRERKGAKQITTKAVDTLLKGVERGGVTADERLDLMEVAEAFERARYARPKDHDRLKQSALRGIETAESFAALPKDEQAQLLNADQAWLEGVGFTLKDTEGAKPDALKAKPALTARVKELVAGFKVDAEKATGTKFKDVSMRLTTVRLHGQSYGHVLDVYFHSRDKAYGAHAVLGRSGVELARSAGEYGVAKH